MVARLNDPYAPYFGPPFTSDFRRSKRTDVGLADSPPFDL
jgi:hypothetical protein